MNTVCELNKCVGCMLCHDVCAKQAIIDKHELDACNQVINDTSCVQCGRCKKVCPVNHPLEKKKPIMWKEGWAKDSIVREKSSSGGLATAIGIDFVRNGGIVCSCLFKNGEFVFDFAETVEQLQMFAGSKYVKSDPTGIYKRVAEKLKKQKKVLFIGLPCQVAALKKLVGESENLYTADLICHGTPQNTILERFLKDYKLSLKNIQDLTFRTKTDYHLELNHQRMVVPTRKDHYTQLFLNGAIYTENCYNCQYACMERVSDITFGDSWGTDMEVEEREKGISLVLCQTSKGVELLSERSIYFKNVDLEKAVAANHQLEYPTKAPTQRKIFMSNVKKGTSFQTAMRRAFPKLYWKGVIKTVLYQLGILRG